MNPIRELAQNERPTSEDAPIKVIKMGEDEITTIFESLGSQTTLDIYTAIQSEPKVASELTDVSDTTMQNIHYHLDKLENAGLISPVDTWVSDTGVEMKVYAPTYDPLIISFDSKKSRRDKLQSVVQDVLPMVGGLSFVSLVVEYLVGFFKEPADPWVNAGAGGYGDSSSVVDLFLQYPGLITFGIGFAFIGTYVLYTYSRFEQVDTL